MSSYSRRRARQEYREWLQWYDSLTPEEQLAEDRRRERVNLKNFLYIMMWLILFVGFTMISPWISYWLGVR